MRKLYFYSLLRQDIGWYDVNRTGDLASILTHSLSKIQEALGEKAALYIFFNTIFVAGGTISLVLGWELALINFTTIPACTVVLGTISWVKFLLFFRQICCEVFKIYFNHFKKGALLHIFT